MGKQDITQLVNAASVALQHKMCLQELATMDFGAVDGEMKPWGVMNTAAASYFIEIPDFEEQE